MIIVSVQWAYIWTHSVFSDISHKTHTWPMSFLFHRRYGWARWVHHPSLCETPSPYLFSKDVRFILHNPWQVFVWSRPTSPTPTHHRRAPKLNPPRQHTYLNSPIKSKQLQEKTPSKIHSLIYDWWFSISDIAHVFSAKQRVWVSRDISKIILLQDQAFVSVL